MKALVLAPLFALVALACTTTHETIIEGAPPATTTDAGTTTTADTGAATTNQCTAARAKALNPIDQVSTGAVNVVSTANGATEIYVDATGGGIDVAPTKPRVYIKFDGTKAQLTDDDAFTSTAWDLALKRTDIYTNSGDAGPGQGGAVMVAKDFDAVTTADAVNVAPEQFFDASCNENTDEAGFLQTTFEGWYNYDVATNTPSAAPDTTFVVKSADGTLYKLQIVSNTGTATGGTNATQTANYLLKVAKL